MSPSGLYQGQELLRPTVQPLAKVSLKKHFQGRNNHDQGSRFLQSFSSNEMGIRMQGYLQKLGFLIRITHLPIDRPYLGWAILDIR